MKPLVTNVSLKQPLRLWVQFAKDAVSTHPDRFTRLPEEAARTSTLAALFTGLFGIKGLGHIRVSITDSGAHWTKRVKSMVYSGLGVLSGVESLAYFKDWYSLRTAKLGK